MYLHNLFLLHRMTNMMSKIKPGVNIGFPVDYRIFRFGFSEHVGSLSFGKKNKEFIFSYLFPLTCQVGVQILEHACFSNTLE